MSSILFRVDWSEQIGLGHLYRSWRLAYYLMKRGHQICFVSNRPLPFNYSLQKGLLVQILDSVDDAQAVNELVARQQIESIVVDGYHFNNEYIAAIKCNKVFVIDDGIRNCSSMGFHLISSVPTLNISENNNKNGAKFVLLDEAIHEVQPYEVKPVSQILFFAGGTDAAGLNELFNSLDLPKSIQLNILFRNTAQIKPGADNIHFFDLLEKPHSFYVQHDLAVVAAGSVAWELAYLGLPQILIKTAENQTRLIDFFMQNNMGFFLGSAPSIKSNIYLLQAALEKMLEDKSKREEYSRNSKALVDGYGLSRIASIVSGDPIWIRRAIPSDIKAIFEMANDPVTRGNSFVSKQISWDEHKNWYASRIQKEGSPFYVFLSTDEEDYAGYVRFDQKNKDDYLISINVAGQYRGQGLGSKMISRAINELKVSHRMKCILAVVKKDNLASQASFKRAGFIFRGASKEFGHDAVEYIYRG